MINKWIGKWAKIPNKYMGWGGGGLTIKQIKKKNKEVKRGIDVKR